MSIKYRLDFHCSWIKIIINCLKKYYEKKSVHSDFYLRNCSFVIVINNMNNHTKWTSKSSIQRNTYVKNCEFFFQHCSYSYQCKHFVCFSFFLFLRHVKYCASSIVLWHNGMRHTYIIDDVSECSIFLLMGSDCQMVRIKFVLLK
jgi:hypothetical protein